MLTKLKIENFKCFLNAEMELQALNLLVGANSSGKSSAIQALRLCLDNAGKPQGKEILMSSKDKRTGRFSEIGSFLTTDKIFAIELTTDEGQLKTSYTFGDDARTTTLVMVESEPKGLAAELAEMPVFYLPANRDSAKDAFPMNLEAEMAIGTNGEYVIDYYAHHSSGVLDDAVIYDKSLKTLEGQVNYWLRQLTGYTLKVVPQGNTFRVTYKNAGGRELRPYHVGTGVSFIAAMLIVCLSMPEGGVVIIENPEIHLHPKAQAVAIDFFSIIAGSGRQMLIETHSDHLFNGVRRQIAQKQLRKEDAAIYFFKMKDSQESVPVRIELTDRGRMTKYEKGLFDQFDDDLDAMLQAK